MSRFAVVMAVADQPSIWLGIHTPDRATIFRWDEMRSLSFRVRDPIAIALFRGDQQNPSFEPVERCFGVLEVDRRDDLTVRADFVRAVGGPARSVAIDAALFGAIVLTYPRERVMVRSARAWSVVYEEVIAA